MHYILTPAQLEEYRKIVIPREARDKARADTIAELGFDPLTRDIRSTHARHVLTKHYAIANLPLTDFLNTCGRPHTIKTRSMIVRDACIYLESLGLDSGAVLNITLYECTSYYVTQHWYLDKFKGRWYYRQSQTAKAKHLVFPDCPDAETEHQSIIFINGGAKE